MNQKLHDRIKELENELERKDDPYFLKSLETFEKYISKYPLPKHYNLTLSAVNCLYLTVDNDKKRESLVFLPDNSVKRIVLEIIELNY